MADVVSLEVRVWATNIVPQAENASGVGLGATAIRSVEGPRKDPTTIKLPIGKQEVRLSWDCIT